MYFSRCLSTNTFLVCCSLCFTLISCKPQSELTDVQRVNKELLDQDRLQNMTFALIAASTGKHLFEMPESVSDDCVRTAKVALDLFTKPSTFKISRELTLTSIRRIIQDPQLKNSSHYAIEVLCKVMNEESKNATYFPNLELLKKNVECPKPAKSYYIKIQPGQSVGDMMINSISQFDDPAFFKVYCANNLLIGDMAFGLDAESVTVSKTIVKLAEREAFKLTVDRAFEQFLDEYVKEVSSKNSTMLPMITRQHYPDIKKMDAYFLNNSVLQEEYKKIKKEITDERVRSGAESYALGSFYL